MYSGHSILVAISLKNWKYTILALTRPTCGIWIKVYLRLTWGNTAGSLSDTVISSYFKHHRYQQRLEITIYFWGDSIQMITFHRMNGCWYFEWLDLIKKWSNSVVVQVTYYCCWIRKENIKDQLERGCLPFYNIFNNIVNKNRKWESDVDLSTLISIVKSKSID